jgi:lipopolysaccharide transport system ATP-binding protein
MTDIAIRVENLSKLYTIGGKQEQYKTLRDVLAASVTSTFRTLRSTVKHSSAPRPDSDSRIWALKGVSFEIKRGEVVGIIGRNGAGKSTLLKLLSRITEPTEGYADIYGRIGSLLEVGTGFHAELTGRENIFLNGAILGMRRDEIKRKFDEIVEFAEVSKFIDTPVKHYSSGMYLRLAFSVAAHLEPEILLVDEVLAVGDIKFQKKCLGKMEDVAARGRTVLFVSHNLGVIKELCQTSIVLNNGLLEFRGPAVQGLVRYSQSLIQGEDDKQIGSNGWQGVRINGQLDSQAVAITAGDSFSTEAWLDLHDDFIGGHLYCIVNNSVGDVVVHQRIDSSDLWPRNLESNRYHVRVEFPPLWLAPSVYTLHFKFYGRKRIGGEERHLSERVVLDISGSINGLSKAHLAPPLNWTFTTEPMFESQRV